MIEDVNNNQVIQCKMISANCNTLLNAVDYSETHRCLAFSSSNLIHIYDPFNYKTHLTLRGHKQRVNVVRWVDSSKCKNELIELLSCSADGTIIHWINCGKDKNPYDHSSWKIEQVYSSSEPNQPVNLLHSLFISPFEKYFAAFSSSGKLDLFYFDIDLKQYKMFHSIPYKKKLQDAVCLTVLNENYLLLLTGGYDSLINVYTVMRVKEINHCIQQKVEFSPVCFKISIQGHLNDIRDIAAISPFVDSTDEFYFATCSQDTYIRVWRIVALNKGEIMSLAETINQKGSLSVFDEYKSKTSYVIKTEHEEYYNIILDSVLSGHEESVSSVKWGRVDDKKVLLTSSFDFTVGVWRYDDKYNIWNKEVTLGEMTGNRHSFFSALFLDNNNSILAYTFNGAFYFWKYSAEDKTFRSQPVVHGHFGAVSDLDWDPSSSKAFLVTTSEDQTTRIFAQWKKNDSWHEVNRPQIHGYDINTVALLNEHPEACMSKIVSGADEKIIRTFNAPFNIIKFLQQLSQVNLNFSREHDNNYYEKFYLNTEGAKQALGLMTRQAQVDVADDEEAAVDFFTFNPDELLTNKEITNVQHDYSVPPDEDFLSNNTLWPEASKLYGHGYEVISLAVSHNGKFIASGGKAQSEKHAKLFIWNAEKNNLICKLDGHVLTIVQIEFSRDDEYILTVSRDRSLCLYQRNEDISSPYKLVQIEKETHGRIIWGCSWSSDSKMFVTGSRDTFIKVWARENLQNLQNLHNNFMEVLNKEFASAVTSVNIVPELVVDNKYVLIVGLENGEISIHTIKLSAGNAAIEQIVSVPSFLTHAATVRRIKSFINKDNKIRIASCSDDHSVRIFEVDIELLKKDSITKTII